MTFEKRVEELEKYIFKRMSDSGIVGLSITTLQDDEVTYRKGIGFRDFEEGTSATPETIYCIGSVTKTFTALAVMQLQEKDLISLDDPITEYVPFPVKPMDEPIRVRHLLSHSSGLPSLGYAEATLGAVTGTYDEWFPISSPKDLLIYMNGAQDWVLAKPGQRHAYLNEGYILLGSIIEQASGLGYADYVEENILKPLGMSKSTFHEAQLEKEQDIATPYITNQDGAKVSTRYPYGQMIADGGLMSTAIDMTRYIRMLFGGGILDGNRIAKATTIKDMMEPKVRTVEEPLEGESYRYYAYGLRVKSDFLGRTLLYHSGSVFGSSAYMGLIPEERVGVAVLANGGYYLEDIGEFALSLLKGRDPMDIPYFKRMNILDSLTGTYITFRGTSKYEVTRSGGLLQLTSSFWRRSYTTPLIPVDLENEPKQFKVYGLDTATPVQFTRKGKDTFMVHERTMAKKICS